MLWFRVSIKLKMRVVWKIKRASPPTLQPAHTRLCNSIALDMNCTSENDSFCIIKKKKENLCEIPKAYPKALKYYILYLLFPTFNQISIVKGYQFLHFYFYLENDLFPLLFSRNNLKKYNRRHPFTTFLPPHIESSFI